MSQMPNEPSESRQTHIDLVAFDFKDTEVPCKSYLEVLKQWYLWAHHNGVPIDIPLAEMCQMLLGHIVMVILDKIEPQVTAHRHVRVPEVAASTSTDTYLDPLLSGCSYCRVTNQDVETCVGNILNCCFRQFLYAIRSPSFDSVKLRTLFSAEVAKRVNSVLSYCTGPARVQLYKPSDSVVTEMVRNVINIIKTCRKPHTSHQQPMNIYNMMPGRPKFNERGGFIILEPSETHQPMNIYDMTPGRPNLNENDGLIMQEPPETHQPMNIYDMTPGRPNLNENDGLIMQEPAETNSEYSNEYNTDPDDTSWLPYETSAQGSSENTTENTTQNITQNTTENTTQNITQNTTENITQNITQNTTENITQNITQNTTENIAKTSAEPSAESQTLLHGVETFLTLFLAKLVSYIAKKTQTSVANIDFEQILSGVKEGFMKDQSYTVPQNVQKLHKPIYKELKQHFGSKYELQYRMAKADPFFMALVAITLKAQLKKTEKPKKIWRIFQRNNKVHVCGNKAAESHSKENEVNGSTPSHQHNRQSSCFTWTFASIFSCLRKAFTGCCTTTSE